MDGNADDRQRDALLARFRDTPRAVLVATRVCDAAVDFPADCVVVQVHSASGSRQTEVQRAGRGTRGRVEEARVVHLVNEDTEEMAFVERRVEHMRARHGANFVLHGAPAWPSAPAPERDVLPMRALLREQLRRRQSGAGIRKPAPVS